MAMKKAVFFTIDSLLASGIVIVSIVLIANLYSVEQRSVNVSYASQDLVRVFSAMTVSESSNDYVQSLVQSGDITNTNNTILEQIGNFWAEEKNELARNFTKNLTEDIFPSNYGFSIVVNGEEIHSRNLPVKRTLVSSKKIITGIAKAKPTEGFTSRVLLSGIKSKKTSAYSYFGGYEGDGNLTKILILPNDVISLNGSYLEVDAGGNFDFYINGAYSGSYAKGTGGGGAMAADKWNISDAYLSNFAPGTNTMSIVFTSGNQYIAGGFLRVTYTTSSYNDTQMHGTEKYMFPGINGVINLYSSIYVPGELNGMAIFLNYSSDYTTFLRLGNITVYEDNPNGTMNVTLSNSTLSALLDFSSFNQRTMPLRLGLTNGTTLSGNADVVLVSDVSGSMDWCSKINNTIPSPLLSVPSTKGCVLSGGVWKWLYYNFSRNFGYPNYNYSEFNKTIWNNGTNDLCACRYNTVCKEDSRKLDIYINSSKQFVDTLFNIADNKAGLVEFTSNYGSVYKDDCTGSPQTTIPFPESIARFTNITDNEQLMVNNISTTKSWWGTCTCCGINKAVELIESQNAPLRKKFIVLMSDGEATVTCAQQPNSTAIADGVQAAWDACNKGISVYAIAFGNDANFTTMQRMNCSGGQAYNATDTIKLQAAYQKIAGEINKLSFAEQTANATGIKTSLYPNSYIMFNYTPQETEFNKIPLSFETERFGNNISSGILTIYPNTSALDAKVTSYSGTKWTDKLVVNGNTAYWLSDYGQDYQILGDPFAVNIPVANLNEGNNAIAISTGTNSTNTANGSSDDRVIYTLLLNGFADYSSVVAKSDGCSWSVGFEDGTSSTINIPRTYNGADACSFSSQTYDADDALDNAVYRLFSNLDIDKDGKLDVKIDENNLDVNTLTISKVPSLWGPLIIEIRVWE
ncbi:VWA domain-containing protein [Candidatus Woesearchaeota archaeon]|nr:VWA domain-containing protein [Candidatus Woesearchaeota archaeon]